MEPMAPKVVEVLPTGEAREHLSETLRRFRDEGPTAEPLVFGVHRKPEGVVIPYGLYEHLTSLIDDAAIVEEVQPRLAAPAQEIGWAEGLAELGVDPDAFE